MTIANLSLKPSQAQLDILQKLTRNWKDDLPWPIELFNSRSLDVCIKNGWAEKFHHEVGLSTYAVRITDTGRMLVEYYTQKAPD